MGQSVIDEMVRFGILLDLSHTGSKTAKDAMDYMGATYPGLPYVYTHSVPAGGVIAIFPMTKRCVPRNQEAMLRQPLPNG